MENSFDFINAIVLKDDELIVVNGGKVVISCGGGCGTNCGTNCGAGCGNSCGNGCLGMEKIARKCISAFN